MFIFYVFYFIFCKTLVSDENYHLKRITFQRVFACGPVGLSEHWLPGDLPLIMRIRMRMIFWGWGWSFEGESKGTDDFYMQAWWFWLCAAATEDIEENTGMTGISDEMKKPAGREAPTSPTWLETNRGWKSKNVKPCATFTLSNIRLYCGTLFNGHCGKPHFKRVFKLFKVIWIPSCIAWNGKGSFAHYCTDLHWYQIGKHCAWK